MLASAMRGLTADVAEALRQARQRPGLALAIVLTLGCAIGVGTSLFAVYDALFLKPWPVPDPWRVVTVSTRLTDREWSQWPRHFNSLAGLAAKRGSGAAIFNGRWIAVDLVGAGYFDVLDIPLWYGRGFLPEDDIQGDGRSVVVSHRLWQGDLAADPHVLGRSVFLEGRPFTVVGVAAPGFSGVRRRVDAWLPLTARSQVEAATSDDRVSLIGRLAPGVSVRNAEAEIERIAATFRTGSPTNDPSDESQARVSLRTTDVRSQNADSTLLEHGVDLSLLASTTFLTFVACANVANLLLARGLVRRQEIAVRLALGAGRSRLVRQMMIEALCLALVGGGLGLALAKLLPNLFLSGLPLPIVLDMGLDHRVFGWALAMSVGACVAFGSGPAWQCTRVSLSQRLTEGRQASVPALRTSLASYQAIVSVMTLVIAGLLLRTVERDPGWRLIRQLRNVSFVDVGLPGGYSAERRAQVHEAVFERLRSLAGARNVAAASGSPASGAPGLVYVTPEYFETLRLPMVSGRGLDESDQPGEAAVVNESLAHLDWPNDNPLGKSLASGLWTFSSGTWRSADCARCTVVGVVKDREVAGEAPDQSWRIYQIALPLEMNAFIVRGGPRIAGSIAPVLVSIDPGVRVEVLRGTDWAIRHRPVRILCARLALALGSLALAFGAVGLFSISAYAVTQRTHEIGVRRALGAGGAVILGVVFGPVARALLRGCVIGGLGSVAAAQVMRVVGWLEGIGPLDPPTYVGVLLVLLVVTPVAAYMPARRAMRIEPMDALRHE